MGLEEVVISQHGTQAPILTTEGKTQSMESSFLKH